MASSVALCNASFVATAAPWFRRRATSLIDLDVWNDVVGRVPVKPGRHPWRRRRPARRVPRALAHESGCHGPATEIDLAETVVPPTTAGTTWVVFKERSCVDVLLHHRDSRPVPAHGAWAIVLWRSAPTAAALMATDPTVALGWLVTALAGAGANPAAPAGWDGTSPAAVPPPPGPLSPCRSTLACHER